MICILALLSGLPRSAGWEYGETMWLLLLTWTKRTNSLLPRWVVLSILRCIVNVVRLVTIHQKQKHFYFKAASGVWMCVCSCVPVCISYMGLRHHKNLKNFFFFLVNLYNFIRSSWPKVVDIATLKYLSYFRGSFCLYNKWHSLRFPMTKCICPQVSFCFETLVVLNFF